MFLQLGELGQPASSQAPESKISDELMASKIQLPLGAFRKTDEPR
jgi:hypothetical protein